MPKKPSELTREEALFVAERIKRDYEDLQKIKIRKKDVARLEEAIDDLFNKKNGCDLQIEKIEFIRDEYYKVGSVERKQLLDAKIKFNRRQKPIVKLSESVNKSLTYLTRKYKMNSKNELIEYLLNRNKKYNALLRQNRK